MEGQLNIKSKVTPTEEQKTLLLAFREERGMISTRQHDLISECHSTTGLPVNYIKQWIGNQNSKGRGTRKGGSQYKVAGKPRVLSGYNIFCSEIKAPEAIWARGMTAQNRWWSSQWNALSDAEREVYNARARGSAKSVATEQLTGEALDQRKNYLLKELANLCDNLSKAGVEVAAYVVESDEEETFTGSNNGIQFLESRATRSRGICREFERFVQHVKFAQSARRNKTVLVDAPAEIIVSAPEDPDTDIQVDEPVTSNTTATPAPTPEGVEPSGSFLHSLNVSVEPAVGPSIEHQQDTNIEEPVLQEEIVTEQVVLPTKATTSTEVIVNSENSSLQSPVNGGEARKQTALDILLPLSNGGLVKSSDIVMETANPEPVMSTRSKNKKTRRNRKPDDMIGKAIELLWVMEGDEPNRWYQGIVIERCGWNYKIQYSGEKDPRSVKVTAFKKGLKKKTVRLL